jgi:hypothetical protein
VLENIFYFVIYFQNRKRLEKKKKKKKKCAPLSRRRRERERESTLQPSFSFVSQNNMTHHACSYFISPNSQKS